VKSNCSRRRIECSMSALTLFVLCCAGVQVQSGITPYVFSDRTYYNVDSSNNLSGEDLFSAVFKVRFNQPLGSIIGWEDTSTPSVLAGVTVYPSFEKEIVAVGVPGSVNSYGFDFTLRATSALTNFPSESSLTIKAQKGFFCKPEILDAPRENACELGGFDTNTRGSYVYTFEVGSTFTYATDWNSQGVDQITAVLTFDHSVYDKSQYLPAMKLQINGNEVDALDQSFIASSDTTWMFNVYGAVPSSIVCLVPVEGSSDKTIIGDVYGNGIKGVEILEDDRMCYTMPAEPLCGDWSEWSDTCTYLGCVPIPEDEQFNLQTRTRRSAEFPNCDIAPESRVCEVEPSFPPCTVRIRPSEVGNECEADQSTCDSGGTIGGGQGCQCGGDCMLRGNCCQSYFKTCIGEEEATTNPIYFYSYAPCWNPSVCTQSAPTPPTTFACGNPNNNNGGSQCNSRPYSYSCFCGFSEASGLTCGNIGGSDLCCSGESSFKALCN